MLDKAGFKIGDKVRIICMKPPDWSNGMKLIGQVGIIENIVSGDAPIVVEFNRGEIEKVLGDNCWGNKYNFQECEIERAVRVGEQLVFEFMND